jgi:glycosyltransferase domain-containing protein
MEVALLVPTLNRPDFIERVVGYYSYLKSPHPIYIGDASDSEGSAKVTAILKKYGDLKLRYFHWPGLGASRTVVRLAESAKAECDFCVSNCDDDYFVPSALSLCAKFLTENKGYRTAQGRSAIFTLDRPGAYGRIQSLGQYWGVNELEQETGLERLENFAENYYVSQFSLHRIEEFLSTTEDFLEIQDTTHGEIFQSHAFAILGKSKFLDCLYLVRNDHDDRAYKNRTFINWIMQKCWFSDFEKCHNALSLILQESSDLSLSQSRKIIFDILETRFENHSYKFLRANRSSGFLSSLRQLLPIRLKKILRQLSSLTMEPSDMRLLGSKRSDFYKDWLPVQRSFERYLHSKD